jgi:uracil-DNA glycosylase
MTLPNEPNPAAKRQGGKERRPRSPIGDTQHHSPVPADEIYERYLQKAISEINDLGDEIAQAAGANAPIVLGSGHPLADVLLLKYSPQESEFLEGVAFYGRAGQAVLKSLQRLGVDPMAVYGTNCLKFAGAEPDERAREWLTREVHIVQPKLVVVMGEHALEFLNTIAFPLSAELGPALGEIQRFTPTVDGLYVPDIDASLDEQAQKTRFWNAFKTLGAWWAELPPY